MNIAICDDDRDSIIRIKTMLEEFFSEKKVNCEIFLYCDGAALLESEQKYDMAFIDVEMPEVNGIKAAKEVFGRNCDAIIFIMTAHQKYLDDAMDINVYRFFTKPVDKNRLFRSLQKATVKYLSSAAPVYIEYEDEVRKVNSSDILYIVIENRYTSVYTKFGKFPTKQNMSFWVNSLNPNVFAKCHKSFLVNMKYVTDFNKTEVVLTHETNKVVCQCSRRCYYEFKEKFYTYLGLNKCSGGGCFK